LAAQDSEFIGSRRPLWFGIAAIATGVGLLLLAIWSWQQRPIAAPEAAAASGPVEAPPAGVSNAAESAGVPREEPAAVLEPAPAAPVPAVTPSGIDNVSSAEPAADVAEPPAPVTPGMFVEWPGKGGEQTDAELELLRRQLASLPPEDLEPDGLSSPVDACKLCWSLVYRPLYEPENL
jgi:hypothetical protein